MFSPLIHSTTNYAKRKPIPRLFPEKRYLENMYDNFDLRMGHDGERVTEDNRFDGDHVAAQASFDKLGTFAERNAKPERKTGCQSAGPGSISQNQSLSYTDQKGITPVQKQNSGADSISPKSPSSPPAFKVGDLVECLPDKEWTEGFGGPNVQNPEMVAQVGKIATIGRHATGFFTPCVGLAPLRFIWPIRAIRHVETEPQESDGSIMNYDPSNGELGLCIKNDFSVFYYPSTKNWEHAGNMTRHSSWIELKRALEAK